MDSTQFPQYPEPEEEKQPFVILDDDLAEWALKRIKEAEDEHTRLIALVDKEQEKLDERRRYFDNQLERDTAFLKAALADYMRRVPCKSTKTQDSYQLLSGKLVRRKAGVDYEVNAEALAKWLNENGREDLVKVTVAPRWGDLKKLLTGDTESGAVTIASTGEMVEGVKAIENPEKFTIKFNTEKE